MEADIDKLNIEITSNSDKAAKSIDNLCGSLAKLKENAVKNTGLDKLNKQLAKLHETSQQLSGLKAHAERVNEFSATINKLSGLKIPSVTKMRNRIKQLVDMSHEMADFKGSDKLAESVNQICDTLKPMEKMGKNTLAPFVNSLGKISDITKKFDNKSLQDFRNLIKEITSSIQPLISQVSKSEKGLVSLNRIIQSNVSSNGNLASSNAAAVKSYTSVSSILTSTKAKLLAYGYALSRVIRVAKEWVDLSNNYIENLNLFSVAMGNEAQSALNYANTVNKALGIDVSDWIRNQGVFKQVTSGFGVLDDKSNLMSKNLTQLGYDISSFFNIDVDEAMQKLQSGISGELEPLRRLGYALDQATLQQIAYSKGIRENISKMTQAQKSQLRYIAILQQSKNVMGDMARTVTTPANAMRILEQQITQLKRSIGNILSILVQKLLPYIQAFVKLLGEAAEYLAKKWGFELPKIDYSNVSNGLNNVSSEADNATESVKQAAKEMQRLAGFDELNILSSNSNESKSDSTTLPNSYDLGIEIPEYDFLSDIDTQTEEIYKKIKSKLKELYKWWEKHKEIIEHIAKVIAVLWAISKIKKFIGFVKNLWEAFKKLSLIKTVRGWVKNFIDGFKSSNATTFFGKLKDGVKNFRKQLTPAQKVLGTIVGTVMASYGSYNLFYDLTKDTLTWKSALGDAALIVGGLGVSWLFGGTTGLAIGLIGTAIGAIVGHVEALHDKYLELDKAAIESELFNNGGTRISDLTEAFKDQFQPLSDLNDKLHDYDQKIGDNKTAIEDYTTTVDGYAKKIEGTGTLAEQELGPMKEAVDGLADSLKNSMDLDCSKFFDTVKQSISGVAQGVGIDVGKMTTTIEEFQKKFSDEVSKSQKIVDDYIEKLASGVQVTPEETAQYKKNLEYLTNMGRDITQAKTNFQNAIKNASNIDFEDPESSKEAIADLKKYADEAKTDAKEIYQSSLNTYDNLMKSLKYNYDTGKIDKKYYDTVKKQLDDYKTGVEKAYEDSRSEIKKSLSGAIQKIYDSANEEVFKKLDSKNNKNLSQGWAKKKIEDLKETMDYVYSEIDAIAKEKNITLSDKKEKEFLKSFKKGDNSIRTTIEDTVHAQFRDYNALVSGEIEKSADSASKKIDKEATPKIKKSSKKATNSIASGIKESKPAITGQLNGIKTNFQTFINQDVGGFYTFGNSIPQNIASGIKDGTADIRSALEGIQPKSSNEWKTTNKIRLPGFKSQITLPGFASGGYPTTGQLFYARENGRPEMVGKIGSQTAVANNNQIEKAIADAVFRAITSASRSSADGQQVNVNVPVYVDGQKMDEQQYSYKQRQFVRSNGKRN